MMGWKRRISTAVTLLFSLTFFCFVASAAVNWQKASYFKNFGGLNDAISSTEIADNEATDIQNIIFDTGGAISKRHGYTTVGTSTTAVFKVATGTVGAITGLKFFKKDSGTRYLVGIAYANNKATAFSKTFDSGGTLPTGAWDSIDYSGLPTSYDGDQKAIFTTAADNLVITLETTGTATGPFKWTGTGNVAMLTSDTDCPTATLSAYHKNFLFLSGNSTYPSRIYFSAVGDITDWTVTDFLDVSTSDGSKVRALLSAYDGLYIFKDTSIWRLTGTNRDDFTLEKMVDGIGTLSQPSIAIVNNLIYFTTAQNDIAVYDGNYTVKFISQKIRGTVGSLNFNRADNTCGIGFSTYKYVDNDYYVSVSGAGQSTNDTVLMFDTAHSAWTKFDGMNASSWTVGDSSTGQYALYFGDYSGYVHQYPSSGYYDGQVATSAIAAHYQTKWFRYPEVSLGDKYLRLLKTYVNSESSAKLDIEAKSDYNTAGTTYSIDLTQSGAAWDSAVWDVDTWTGQYLIIDREETNKGTNMFQLKFSNENVNEGFTIIGFENFIEPVDRI